MKEHKYVPLKRSACCSIDSLTIFQKQLDTAKLKFCVVIWLALNTPVLHKVIKDIQFLSLLQQEDSRLQTNKNLLKKFWMSEHFFFIILDWFNTFTRITCSRNDGKISQSLHWKETAFQNLFDLRMKNLYLKNYDANK